jgi:hypothetical protein
MRDGDTTLDYFRSAGSFHRVFLLVWIRRFVGHLYEAILLPVGIRVHPWQFLAGPGPAVIALLLDRPETRSMRCL